MAINSVQYTPATGDEAIFNDKQYVKLTGGWPVVSSGDGLAAFSAVGDVIVNAGAGAGGMANPGAWFRQRAPDSSRERLFQRQADSRTWSVWYSVAGFTGGAPNANTPPTAADQVLQWDNATMLPADGTYRLNITVDDAANYGTYSWGWTAGGGACLFAFFDDPLSAGSAHALDQDPTAHYIDYQGAGNVGTTARVSQGLNNNFLPGQGLGAWLRYDMAAPSAFVPVCIPYLLNNTGQLTPPGIGFGPNAFDGVSENPIRCIYGRQDGLTDPTGWKGQSENLVWLNTTTAVVRVTGDVLDLPGGVSYCLAGQLWVRWEQGVVSVI